MAEGINIKVLPQTDNVQGNDRILIDRNIVGTLVIPFSSIVVNENQVTFYSDFVNLSAFTQSLSATTNAGLLQIESNLTTNSSFLSTEIASVSTNVFQLSSTTLLLETNLNIVSSSNIQLRTIVNTISSNLVNLSANTTTFISGGISPSGSIVPNKVGILYFAADTKDYFVSVDNISDQDWRRILTVDY
jgi:hypothetical protein